MSTRIALWERKLSVVLSLGILGLAHWAILWRGMFIVHADWDPTRKTCIVDSTNHVFLNVGFFTSKFWLPFREGCVEVTRSPSSHGC